MHSLENLSRSNTPCYVINGEKLKNNLSDIYDNFNKCWNGNIILGYSVKTNHFPYLLQWAKDMGMMAEVVSTDEYNYALAQGFEEKNIIFNGPQKSAKVLLEAIKKGSLINIDNMDELDIIEEHRKELPDLFNVGLRINFDLEQNCKNETTAGDEVSRFGICVENGDFETAVNRLHNLKINISGLHLHYSTKSRSLNVFETLSQKACELALSFNLVEEIDYIDIGGGFFGGRILPGKPTMEEYSKAITGILKGTFTMDKVKLILEPGASLIATAIDYYCKVRNIRDIRGQRVVTVDGSILHINPFMQNRTPEFEIMSNRQASAVKQVVCGATCMEMDRFFTIENNIELKKDDLIKIKNAGAYTLAFNSCFINTPPAVYLEDNKQMIELRCKNNVSMSLL